MSISQLANQIMVLFLLMFLGALIRALGFFKVTTISEMTNMLLYFASPIVIFNSFQKDFSLNRLHILGLVLVAVIFSYIVMIVVAKLIFQRVQDPNLRRIARYGSVYCNNGFMGIPLALALFGNNGVFYGVASMAGFNLFSWTQGVGMFRQQQPSFHEQLKQIFKNPNIIAIILDLLAFVFSLKMPTMISTFMGDISSAYGPMSMIVIGCNLVGLNWRDLKLPGSMWITLLLRNLIFPIITILILRLLGVTGVALYTTVILSACPVAGVVVLFTLQAKDDTKPAVVLMSISTLLSLITIPICFALTML